MRIAKTKQYRTFVKRWETDGKFGKKTAHIQRLVEADLGHLNPPRRADGTISLDGDWLRENVPEDHAPLQALLRHDKLVKILGTYLHTYSQTSRIFPRLNTIGPKSGRRSSSRPNIQNVPKRKWGIRGLFVPRPGHYFIKCDYTAQELFTLAQAMIDLGIGKGSLWDCVTSDLDPHILGATKTLGKDYDDITEADRQGQKVVAFGVPGGLGVASLQDYAYKTFGVKWTKEESKAARDRFLRGFPDVDKYLKSLKYKQNDALVELTGSPAWEWQNMLDCGWNVIKALCEHDDPDWRAIGEKASRMTTGKLRSGRIRKHARFTEIANTHFQGLASDVTKHAEWLCFKEFGRPPTIVCHDEIVMEFPFKDKYQVEHFNANRERLEDCMKQAFIDVCPDVGPYSKCESSKAILQWGPSTDKDGNVLQSV